MRTLLKRTSFSLSPLVLVVFVALQAPSVFASGSSAVGQAKTGGAAAYNQGKRVFATKVACGDCPNPNMELNKTSAQSLLSTLPELKLSEPDQEALAVYLKRRFKL